MKNNVQEKSVSDVLCELLDITFDHLIANTSKDEQGAETIYTVDVYVGDQEGTNIEIDAYQYKILRERLDNMRGF